MESAPLFSDLIALLTATVVGGIAAFRFPNIWRSRAWATDRMAFMIWTFLLFLALGMTLQVPPVFMALDARVLPNLGRLMSYILISLAFYFLSAGLYRYSNVLSSPEKSRFTWFTLITLLVQPAFVVLYGLHIHRLPQLVDPSNPVSAGHLLFMEILYLYIFMAITLVGYATWRQFQAALRSSFQRRLFMNLILVIVTLVGLAAKIPGSILMYLGQALALTEILRLVFASSIALAAILLVLIFLPTKFYKRLLSRLLLHYGWITYWRLQAVLNEAAGYCPEDMRMKIQPVDRSQFVLDPRIYLDDVIYSLEDQKVILRDALEQNQVSGDQVTRAMRLSLFLQSQEDIHGDPYRLGRRCTRIGAKA